MAARPAFWSRPRACLDGLLPRARRYASLHPGQDRLETLLTSIQKRDTPRIYESFIAWTEPLADQSSPDYAFTVSQVQSIPGPTLSEILRSLDPVSAAPHDVARGLRVSQGQTQFVDAALLLDTFGVRRAHRKMLRGVEAVMEARRDLAPPDYQVLMRCAGAAVDRQGAKTFWASMADEGRGKARTSASWTEFVKARFMADPVYYQFDRARVAVLPRDMYSNRSPMPMATIKRLDHLRLSLAATQLKEPWNRRRDEPDEDLRRLMRRRPDYRGFKNHWIRSLYYGYEMDEELLCASMIAYSRSASLLAIKNFIIARFYGVNIRNIANPAETEIFGGRSFHAESLVKPTPRLLHAIVDAFGSMAHIALASRLLTFFSQRYEIPIPHETWSNLLNWTYLCTAKPFSLMRRVQGPYASTTVSPLDVLQVWDTMTSEPYNVRPTLDDVDILVKLLIERRNFPRALSVIREHAIPLYDSLVEEHQTALLDEAFRNDSFPADDDSLPGGRAGHRRRSAELRKDRAHAMISTWFAKLLKSVRRNKHHPRDSHLIHVLIPSILAEFAGFFPQEVRYHTHQGEVRLLRPEEDHVPRFDWESRFRVLRAEKVAGIYVRHFEGADQPEFPWPRTDPIRLREWVRRPRRRMALGAAPHHGDDEWWGELEGQLMR